MASSSSGESNSHPWKRAAWEASQGLSDSLIALPSNYPVNRTMAISEAHEAAQKMLFEYLRAFEPKKDQLGADEDPEEVEEESLWWQPIANVPEPRSGVIRLDDADFLRGRVSDKEVLNRIYSDIPTSIHTVRLATIRQHWQRNAAIELTVKGWVEQQGYLSRTITETRYLPVSAIVEIRRHLDDCMEELGWLPEIQQSRKEAGFDYADLLPPPGEEPPPVEEVDQRAGGVVDG